MHQQPLLAPTLPNRSSRAGQRSGVSGRIVRRMSPPAALVIFLLPLGLTTDRVALSSRVVQDEVALSVVDNDGHVRAATPLVGHDAFRADRICSGKVQRPDVVSVHPDIQRCGEVSVAVEYEPTDSSKVPDTNDGSGGMQT